MIRKKIAITIRSFDLDGPAMSLLKKNCDIDFLNNTGARLNESEVIGAIHTAEGVIAGTEPFSRNVISSSDSLRVISRVGIGIDNIDTAFAKQKNVRVCNTPQTPIQSVAEHTLALTFALLKNIPYYTESMRKGQHSPKPGFLLAGKTVGIVGLGRIGTRVAALFQALGCSILYFDPFVVNPPDHSWQRVENLSELARSVDILSVHVSAKSDSPPLMDAAIFSVWKNGAFLINTSRGNLIDENALASALKSGVVAGAGLDVFSHEPYTGKLLSFPQVISTPHIASNTVESRLEMEMEAVSNLLNAFKDMEKK